MKYFKFKLFFALAATSSLLFTSCDKAKVDEQLGDQGQHIIKFLTYGGGSGSGFNSANLSLGTDPEAKLEMNLEYSTNQVAENDISVTVEYDAAALAAYNAIPGNAQYEKLPDSTYSFPATTVLIKAGQTISEAFEVTFYPAKIDGSINYMLPLSITNISGAPGDVTRGPSSGTAFLHFIGNPLAGNYDVVGTRYNYTGSVSWAGPPNPLPPGGTPSGVPPVKFASPLNGTTVQLEFAALSSLDYFYLVSGSGTPLFSNITVDYSATFLGASSARNQYISGYVAPAPGVKPEFHIITHYNNAVAGGGNDRIIDEYFRHQ